MKKQQKIYDYFKLPKEFIDIGINSLNDKLMKDYLINSNYYSKTRNNNNYIKIFEDRLKYIVYRYCNGYSLNKIEESLKNNELLSIPIPKYNKISDILKKYNITYENLIEFLIPIPKNAVLCYKHYYGIEKIKYKLYEIPYRLNIKNEIIKENLILVDSYIYVMSNKELNNTSKKIIGNFLVKEMVKLSIDTDKTIEKKEDVKDLYVKQCVKKTSKIGAKRKENFLNYFYIDDRELALKIIEEYKDKNHIYYINLVKLYGDNYDKLDENNLSLGELESVGNFKKIIKRKIIKIKKPKLKEQCGPKRKASFFYYFKEEDKKIVLMLLEEYKKINHPYYKLLNKLYGDNYNEIDESIELTREDKKILCNFKQQIKTKVSKIKQTYTEEDDIKIFIKYRRNSFFEYFDADKEEVLKIIESCKNNTGYKVLVKLYGKNFDTLDNSINLTQNEKNLIEHMKKTINKELLQQKKSKDNTLLQDKIERTLKIGKSRKNIDNEFKNLISKYNLQNLDEKELLILKCIIDKKMSLEDTSKLLSIEIKEIEHCLIKNLIISKEYIPNILNEVLRRGNYSYLEERALYCKVLSKSHL